MSRCIVLLGGSFDPVHRGHVALAEHVVGLIQPNELRIIPAGDPWQKAPLVASPEQRMEMLRLAFHSQEIPITLDDREIQRNEPSYTIATLRELHAELGASNSLVLAIGADQLQGLSSWKEWQQLFEYAHIVVATRPGYVLNDGTAPQIVRDEFEKRLATPEQIRQKPSGLTYLAENLSIDISATAIRAALRQHKPPFDLLPPGVLDYIQQKQLYKD